MIDFNSDQIEAVEPGPFAIGEAARCWTRGKATSSEMDSNVCEQVAKTIEVVSSQAWLGNATTGELLEELKARAEVDGSIDYKTTGAE